MCFLILLDLKKLYCSSARSEKVKRVPRFPGACQISKEPRFVYKVDLAEYLEFEFCCVIFANLLLDIPIFFMDFAPKVAVRHCNSKQWQNRQNRSRPRELRNF